MTIRRVDDLLLALAAGATVTSDSILGLGDDDLSRALGTFLVGDLTGHGAESPYDAPRAFQEFIDGAGNVELYRRAIEQIGRLHRELGPTTLADIGCGDGRVAWESCPATLRHLDLIEPSAELLAQAIDRSWPAAVDIVPHQMTIEQFLAAEPTRWDVVQSTFALHNLPPTDRHWVFAELAGRTDHLIVVEFDVPEFADRSPEHAAYVVDRYHRGVAEYSGNDLVIQGFLMPVLLGQFDPSRPRVTWEQPISAWESDLRGAGFTDVRRELLHDYWWAPAYLLHAER